MEAEGHAPWWATVGCTLQVQSPMIDMWCRFSAAFCHGERLLCSWLPQQGWHEGGTTFLLLLIGRQEQVCEVGSCCEQEELGT